MSPFGIEHVICESIEGMFWHTRQIRCRIDPRVGVCMWSYFPGCFLLFVFASCAGREHVEREAYAHNTCSQARPRIDRARGEGEIDSMDNKRSLLPNWLCASSQLLAKATVDWRAISVDELDTSATDALLHPGRSEHHLQRPVAEQKEDGTCAHEPTEPRSIRFRILPLHKLQTMRTNQSMSSKACGGQISSAEIGSPCMQRRP